MRKVRFQRYEGTTPRPAPQPREPKRQGLAATEPVAWASLLRPPPAAKNQPVPALHANDQSEQRLQSTWHTSPAAVRFGVADSDCSSSGPAERTVAIPVP